MGLYAAEWPDGWTVTTDVLPDGMRGATVYSRRCSIISPDLHPWQRRATCQHEAEHARSGPPSPWAVAREERRVDQEAARRLIDLDALIHVLQASSDATFAAAWLEVPEYMVWARLQGLTLLERARVACALVELQ